MVSTGCHGSFFAMAEALPTLYCELADLESVFSSLGVQWRLDDDDDNALSATEQGFLEDAIREATDLVNQYALNYYEVDQLAESRVVKRWTAWIACFLISRRRGNAAQFVDEYDATIAELVKVSKGLSFIPRITPRQNFQPAVNNYRFSNEANCNSGPGGCQSLAIDDCTSFNGGT